MFRLSYGNLTFLDFSIPQEIYEISAKDGRYLSTSREIGLDYNEFEKWNLWTYYVYLFNGGGLSISLFISIGFVFVLFLALALYKKKEDIILLAFLFFIKFIVFLIITIQYRFLLDGLLIVFVIILYNYKLSFKIITVIVPLFSISFVLSSSYIPVQMIPHFMRGIAKYEAKNLIIPNNYSVSYQTEKLFNFQTNIITNSPIVVDSKQPAIGETILNRYRYFQSFHPILIDSTSIKGGFKAEKNTKKSDQEIDKYLDFIKQKKN